MNYGNIGEDGCPCGEVKEKDYTITAHCWKSGVCKTHPFACVHLHTKKATVEQKKHIRELAKWIKEFWYCDCNYSFKGEL
jgi:hypothetical protein